MVSYGRLRVLTKFGFTGGKSEPFEKNDSRQKHSDLRYRRNALTKARRGTDSATARR
ncbi:hypothetical protein PUN28_012820 [Cardiocondyla obscurior]|uniref:Uncharacterized protein n=1 Tax=Cardiocondyla obscurior TaxID=286306 RepID=A0AAW2F5H6_9HYME